MKLSGKTAALVLLFIALVLVTYLASQFAVRFDFTSDRIYSLSRGTKQLLAKIEEPIAVDLYFSRSTENIPILFKNYATRVEEMLREFVAASQGRIALKVVDPRPDTDEETAARRAGITPLQLRTGEALYFGLVLSQGGDERNIPAFSMDREAFLEYDLAKLIYTVQQFEKPRLGLISTLPLRSPPMMMPGQQPQPDQIVVGEWESAFEIVPIEESAEALPDNLSVLAVIHPQNVGPRLQFAIDQFLLAGNPVLVAVDPSSYYMRITQQRQQNMMMMGPQNAASDLPELFAAWGITFDAGHAVGDLAIPLRNNPLFLAPTASHFNADAQPTGTVKSMWLIEAGAITVADDRGYEVTPLIQSSERSGPVPAVTLNFTPETELARQVKPAGKKENLAVLVRGNFQTAFPEGAPPATPPPGEEAAATPPSDGSALKQSAKPGALIVVGDSDWLLDFASVQRIQMLNAVVPQNDNLVFAANVVEFLGGSEDLISIRGKGRTQRPFDVIRQKELAAQERYQARIEELETQLSAVQEEINKLAATQTAERRLVITPEMEEAIKKFREQEAEKRTELRDIRRALREDVEGLENAITIANVATIPVLVIAFGIAFIVHRSRRQRAA